jgi:hypothetical protein
MLDQALQREPNLAPARNRVVVVGAKTFRVQGKSLFENSIA